MKTLPKFTPVVHITSHSQALEQSALAFSNGADGIFLISHSLSYKTLLDAYKKVRAIFMDEWIGVNFLDLSPLDASIQIPSDADGLWIDEGFGFSSEFLPSFKNYRVFPGIAFKYQNSGLSLEQEVLQALHDYSESDVITTSGPATGKAAEIDKIKSLRYLIGPWRNLALASGVTPNNIVDYLPYVDTFMVATGISESFDKLDKHKVRDMAEIILKY